MRRNLRKTNNNIMFGVIGLAIVALMIAVMFMVLCLPNGFSLFGAVAQ